MAVLLPCQRLEDLPLRQDAEAAEQLLSAWSALWHPALLMRTQMVPVWLSPTASPEEVAQHLLIVPECSLSPATGDWIDRATAQEGTCLIRGPRRRDQMVAAALEQLDECPENGGPEHVEPDLVADFLALGFCYLQVELLARHIYYANDLDPGALREEVLPAAERAVAGDGEAARRFLQAAMDRLYETRQFSYPVDIHLLDLTLVASTTLGQPLRDELAGGAPLNLLVSGELIEEMADREPATLDALRAALEQGTAAIVGGEFSELALSLLPPEAVRAQLQRGLAVYQRYLGVRPTTFGRRRFGLSPVLPQILEKTGFSAAVHCTFDGGRFPVGDHHSRVRWEGIDATPLETVARVPIDAARPESFLMLPETLGNRLTMDHAATVVFAHWPGQSSPWYGDVRRIAARSPVLGSFRLITDYFEETHLASESNQYRPDQYRPPYLRQAVADGQRDPISRWVRYFARQTAVESVVALDALATLVTGRQEAEGVAASGPAADTLLAEIDRSLSAEAQRGGQTEGTPDRDDANEQDDLSRRDDLSRQEDIDGRIDRLLDAATGRLGRSLAGAGRPGRQGCLLVNPFSFSRRTCVEISGLDGPPDVGGAVRAVDASDDATSVVVDLPGMGFAWVGPAEADSPRAEAAPAKARTVWGRRPRQRAEPPLAEDGVLRNEFFEVAIDPDTGAVRSVHDYRNRSARLSQQIAMRLPHAGQTDDEDDDASHYSIMKADRLTLTSVGPLWGEIVAEGDLVDHQARRLARFRQATRIWRGSRLIELRIELDAQQAPGADPWDSYYAARFAWSDATANLYRGVGLANVATDVMQIESPHFVDVRAGDDRTTLLCGGLPYHRRLGLRKLDTLLVVRGETARRFRLGVGIDLPHPVPAALDFLAPRTMQRDAAAPPIASGWLFHLDAPSVLATHWEPLVCEGRVEGFRARLLETDGRRVSLGLRCFRPVASAERILPGDIPPEKLRIEGDRITVGMDPHGWSEVVVRLIS